MKLLRQIRFGAQIFTRRLTGVGLILTRRCDLSCPYCEVIRPCLEGGTGKEEELTVDQWRDIIDRFARFGHRHFVLTGGEPLLYEGIFDLIEHAARRAYISLSTNGVCLDEAALGRMSRLDTLTVAFDHLDGPGGWGKDLMPKIPMIRRYARALGFDVETVTTVTPANIDVVPDVVRKASAAGFKAMLSILHAGAGRHNFRSRRGDLAFRTEEDFARLRAALSELRALKRSGAHLVETDDFLDDVETFARGRFRMPCSAGERWFQVNQDGRVMACLDALPSDVSALDFTDYGAMKRAVRSTVPTDCTCFYNCYYNDALLRRRPAAMIWHRLRVGSIRKIRDRWLPGETRDSVGTVAKGSENYYNKED